MTAPRPDLTALLRAAADRGSMVSLAAELLGGDHAAGEDAVSRAFVAAVEAPPREESAMRAWLVKVTRNFALRERRSRTRRLAREHSFADPSRSAISAAEVAAMEESRRCVVAAVLALDEPLRRVVLDRHWSGLTSAEIAKRYGEPESTVRNRLFRAHERLRGSLDVEFGERRRWRAALMPFASAATQEFLVTGSVAGKVVMGLHSKFVPAAVVVGLLTIATILALRSGESQERPADPDALVVSGANPPATTTDSPSVPGEDGTATPHMGRAEVAIAPAVPRDPFAVRILRADDMAPVPFAELRVLAWDDDPATHFANARRAIIEEWDPERALKGAVVLRANDRGEVEFEVAASFYSIGARDGEYFGSGTIDTRDAKRQHELLLTHDPELRVRVVRSDGGAVADLGVTIDWSQPGRVGRHSIARAFTDASGIATITHVSSRLVVATRLPRAYCVTLGGAIEGAPEVRLDPAAIPREEITLVAPPMGTVEIEFTTADGAPFRNPLGIGYGRSPLPSTVFPGLGDLSWRVAEGGRITIPVGVGASLGVYAFAPDESVDPVRRELLGPASAGERVVHRITIGSPRRRVIGQLADPSGTPLTRRVVKAWYEYTDSDPVTQRDPDSQALSDSAGGFALAMPSEIAKFEPTRLVLEVQDKVQGAARRGTVEVPRVERDGAEIVVGRIRLEDPPLLVQGGVFDDSKRPLGAVTIQFEIQDGAGRWRNAHGKYSATRADGTFEWRDWLEDDIASIRVAAMGKGWYPTTKPEVARGTTAVAITMMRSGRIEGSIELAPGIDPGSLFVALDAGASGVPTATSGRLEHRTTPRADGTFAFPDVAAGPVVVAILDSDPERAVPLLRIDGLVIESGGTNRDPRIQRIQLARYVRAVAVDVVDVAGQPIDGASVRMRPHADPAGPTRARLTDARGRAHFHLGLDDHEVVVTKSGFASAILPHVGAAQRVVLESATRVRIRVTGIDPNAARVEVRMLPKTDTAPDVELQERWLQEGRLQIADVGVDGIADLFAVEAGTYTIVVTRHVREAQWTRIAERDLEVRGFEDVLDVEIAIEK